MLDTMFGTKIDVIQKFTEDGKRIPVTRIKTGPCYVVQIKHEDKDDYHAIQVGWGKKDLRKINKPIKGHLKGAKLKQAPCYLSEVRLDKAAKFKVGDEIKPADIIKPGDKVKITGWSKGKGFTGVVKRWGFAGGPRTHGQSDRQRAPGSIGQTTTPGRVFKGKKMAGRSGGVKVTIAGLTVMGFDPGDNLFLIKGLVPGPRKGRLVIKKVGEDKKFVPLMELGEKIEGVKKEKTERAEKPSEDREELKKVEKGKPNKKIGNAEARNN